MKTPSLDQLYRITRAAESCGLPRSTLESALQRGEIPTHYTACGLPLVLLADVRHWQQQRRQAVSQSG